MLSQDPAEKEKLDQMYKKRSKRVGDGLAEQKVN